MCREFESPRAHHLSSGRSEKRILAVADTAVCLLFLFDFALSVAKAENRWRYLVTWGWLDLLSSIPAVDALRLGRTARILRILRVLRVIRSTKILAEVLLRRRAENAFLAASLVSILLVVIGSISIEDVKRFILAEFGAVNFETPLVDHAPILIWRRAE